MSNLSESLIERKNRLERIGTAVADFIKSAVPEDNDKVEISDEIEATAYKITMAHKEKTKSRELKINGRGRITIVHCEAPDQILFEQSVSIRTRGGELNPSIIGIQTDIVYMLADEANDSFRSVGIDLQTELAKRQTPDSHNFSQRPRNNRSRVPV